MLYWFGNPLTYVVARPPSLSQQWILVKYGRLADVDRDFRRGGGKSLSTISHERLRKSFDATRVSIHLAMFHVAFLRLFRERRVVMTTAAGATVTATSTISTVELKAQLDACFGRPTDEMQVTFQRQIRRIRATRTWPDFFKGIGLKPPRTAFLCQWLRRAIVNSKKRRYHSDALLRRMRAGAACKDASARDSKRPRRPGLAMDDDMDFGSDIDGEDGEEEEDEEADLGWMSMYLWQGH